ncbi:MAG: ATP-binding protein [Gemmatimonadota bacterium]|jgi:signal transduction histidine kinase|nr:ATP-binding protein [Gemmatimonadota bacterium]MDP6801981.1 ATP-binding protein [Gemmatimonadota bacterium]MDP7031329.1 ATP-binding protein [Gemmatimonadota bacterium]
MKANSPGVAFSGGRRRVGLLLGTLALIIVVVNLSNWFILRSVSTSVEEELGRRLVTVASSAIDAATPDLLLSPEVDEDTFVRRAMSELVDGHGLDGLFLVDTAGVVLYDFHHLSVGATSPVLGGEFSAFTRAVAGVPAASPSQEVNGLFLKAAYAPVTDWDGAVGAVLCVTVGSDFFDTMSGLRRTLVVASAVSAVLVALLGIVFVSMARNMMRTETALARSETLSAMGMMAAGIAHEVRNPLAIISGTASLLKRRYPDSAGADPRIDFIPEEVERLNGILEGYLRFARDEPMETEQCDLSRLVARSVEMVEQGIDDDVTIECVGTNAALPVDADPRRIQQVLLNLLLNAVQAMPGGGRICARVDASGDAARAVITDSGPGFSGKELQGAFQPFYTTKESGSGLGLTMAKRIVEAHGGRLTLGNADSGGARVTMEIPQARATRPEEE